MPLETFGEEHIYNFERIGSFGRFYSGDSFPIEYIMTTFTVAELQELTFARDIRPDNIDFELLMQRDIDEERVRLEMEPYLNPSRENFTPYEIRSRSVFFPPLLAAIIPTKGKAMEAYYTDEKSDIALNNSNNKEHVTREWAGLFKLTYFSSSSPHAHRIQINAGENDNDSAMEVGVQCEPVQLEIRVAKGSQYGAKLAFYLPLTRLFKKIKSMHRIEFLRCLKFFAIFLSMLIILLNKLGGILIFYYLMTLLVVLCVVSFVIMYLMNVVLRV